jgi:serine/threonine protein kinase
MAPEQLRGEDLDQRADIYALGSVLYEMLTGLPPHIADTPYEVASLVLTANATPPSERNPEIWPELEQVMLHALNRKRDDRYANATSFAEALQDALLAHDIELIEPASAIKSSYVKFRTSRPLSKSANGSSGSSIGPGGSVWSDGQSHNPAEPPTVPVSDAPPAGKPPRWPPSNQPRDNGAGGGGPGRRILIFALIGALLVLTACAGVAYAIGVFPPGGGTTLASATATSARGDSPTETQAPTTTTGPGTPTSTPAPTKTAKPSATATSTHAPTPTNTPSFPTLTVAELHVYETYPGSNNCTGTQDITNNGPQNDAWNWVVTDGPLPGSFGWGFGGPSSPNGTVPNASQPKNTTLTVFVQVNCSDMPGSGFHIHLHDTFNHDFPVSDVIFKQGP